MTGVETAQADSIRARAGGWYAPLAVLVLYALALLSIDLTSDWHRLHEDNGAMHTTFALSHIKLGLERTRAHDLYFNPKTGRGAPYGHHPPATGLLVALAFGIVGSSAPWVARLVPIVFHLGSLLLMVRLFAHFFERRMALFGGLLWSTLPMGAYFGRMVNYEPLCLFAILLQLNGYATCKLGRRRHGLAMLAGGIVLGGVIDWGALFFTATIATVELWDLMTGRMRHRSLLVTTVAVAALTVAVDLLHLWYAGHGSLALLEGVARGSIGGEPLVLGKFVSTQIETYRSYFTHAGLISSVVVAFCLTRRQTSLSRYLFAVAQPDLARRVLTIAGVAALAYVMAAPSWARVHAYWQFYFLPFVGLGMLAVWRALWERQRARPTRYRRSILGLFVIEVVATTTFVLHLRYTTPGSYAIRQTAILRESFLTAGSRVDRAQPE